MKVEQIAGYIDGKGHLAISRNGDRYRAIFILTSKKKSYLEVLHSTYGGVIAPARGQNRKGIFEWRLVATEPLSVFIRDMIPLLMIKRDIFVKVIEWLDTKSLQDGYGTEFRDYSERIKKELKQLR